MSKDFSIRLMSEDDVAHAALLQQLAFPPPFSEDLHWSVDHLLHHVQRFPEGQFVATAENQIIGSCSNTLIAEERWQAHGSWTDSVGGPFLDTFDLNGTTLYGLDITVHPDHRRKGIGRAFYQRRYDLVVGKGLKRYGTGCRMPDLSCHPHMTASEYALKVSRDELHDRTMTPLLRYGLTYLHVIENYMEDEESRNAAALLEWLP